MNNERLEYRPQTEDLHSHLEMFELRGERDGLHVLIVGGIHGDELTPYVILNSLRDKKVTHGQITVVPFLNSTGLVNRNHEHPGLGIDINRVFNKPEYPELDMLKGLIQNADLVIDFHTHQYTQTLPYGVHMYTADPSLNTQVRHYMQKLGLNYVENVGLELVTHRAQGTMIAYALRQNKVALIVETSNLHAIKAEEIGKIKEAILTISNPEAPVLSEKLQEVKKFDAQLDIIVDSLATQLGYYILTGETLFSGWDTTTTQRTHVVAPEQGQVVTLPTLTYMKKGYSFYRLTAS